MRLFIHTIILQSVLAPLQTCHQRLSPLTSNTSASQYPLIYSKNLILICFGVITNLSPKALTVDME